MKVSHEVPIPFLEKSRAFNQYDYCLPHLLDESKEYFNFFQTSKEMGRYIIMDNSLHELGTPYDSERLSYWLNYFKPNEFIVPDYWQDKNKTLVTAKLWSNFQYPDGTTPVAVVQANDRGEAWECYHILKMQGYKKIAFSYGASWYLDQAEKMENDFVTKAYGRYNTIKDFYEKGLIKKTDRIHLLGCASPFEFSLYKGFDCIESIATSNPVMPALEGTRYNSSLTIDKPKANMNNYFDVSIDDVDVDLIEYNVNQFKNFINQKSIIH